MKLKCIYIYVMCFVFVDITAQSNENRDWSYGIHFGPTYGKMLWGIDDNTFPGQGNVDLPQTPFRLGYIVGGHLAKRLNNRWFLPVNIEYIDRRFAIATGGVVSLNNGSIQVQADYIDYRIAQLSFGSGIGFQILPTLSIDFQPYFQFTVKDQELSIKTHVDWIVDPNFQQKYDYGISGHLTYNVKKLSISLGYQYGLPFIQEYSAFDLNGAPIGKFDIKNTMLVSKIGYDF